MRRGIQIGLLLACAGAPALWGQAMRPAGSPKGGVPKAFPKGPNPKKGPPGKLNPQVGAVERLLAMPPEQRDRVLEKLPSGQQEALRRRFEQFDKRPPEERARLLKMWKHLESLSPERREVVTRQMQNFNALPDERRIEMRRALNQLGRMAPEERDKQLADDSFRRRFTAGELQILSDLAPDFPLQGK